LGEKWNDRRSWVEMRAAHEVVQTVPLRYGSSQSASSYPPCFITVFVSLKLPAFPIYRCHQTFDGDLCRARPRYHVSHYNVIGDTREDASWICLPKNKKKYVHCTGTDGNSTKPTRRRPLDPSSPVASRPAMTAPALFADDGSSRLLRRTDFCIDEKIVEVEIR
jgi:hypothetical protein